MKGRRARQGDAFMLAQLQAAGCPHAPSAVGSWAGPSCRHPVELHKRAAPSSPNPRPNALLLPPSLLLAGEVHRYCLSARGGRLAITLVWTDFPASVLGERGGASRCNLLPWLAASRRWA